MRTDIESILTGKSGDIYKSVLDSIDGYRQPHEFVRQVCDCYLDRHKGNLSVKGRVFELAICETLKREGIVPFYYRSNFTLAINVNFALVCYHPRRPVVLSAKVSLRGRYKRADLESFALRRVYRDARSYLLTLSDEQERFQEKIREDDFASLTDCIKADSYEYDVLLDELKSESFSLAEAIVPIEGKLITRS